MTTSSPQGYPIAVPLGTEQMKDDNPDQAGPLVGASDAAADAEASGAEVPTDETHRDTDGVPVGAADAEEDRRASGA
ncbi:hypothetical protein [Paractinoplanes rishiriensis]|uniref:Uncharacterized protein n=1 Tax=Paractinoplanes rishiriensis TaxID=1050105 RepID=A0A919JUP6_9ACTN|nr:hypothetical protein [Actinoplanes rishiriensis]GIE95551.1 hypothetical protein Ari01nite_30160 [Actinoplanes rishiriensis]